MFFGFYSPVLSVKVKLIKIKSNSDFWIRDFSKLPVNIIKTTLTKPEPDLSDQGKHGIGHTTSSFPGPRLFLNDISSGPGNSKKYDFFWLVDKNCIPNNKVKNYTLLHIGFYFRIDYIQPFLQLRRAFLQIVSSTRPLRQRNPFLNFHEEMSLVTEISAIIVIQFRCLVKRLKIQASLKMLQE